MGECPCFCECGNEFDLDDSFSVFSSNNVVCTECYEKELEEQEYLDLESELITLIDEIKGSVKQMRLLSDNFTKEEFNKLISGIWVDDNGNNNK